MLKVKNNYQKYFIKSNKTLKKIGLLNLTLRLINYTREVQTLFKEAYQIHQVEGKVYTGNLIRLK